MGSDVVIVWRAVLHRKIGQRQRPLRCARSPSPSSFAEGTRCTVTMVRSPCASMAATWNILRCRTMDRQSMRGRSPWAKSRLCRALREESGSGHRLTTSIPTISHSLTSSRFLYFDLGKQLSTAIAEKAFMKRRCKQTGACCTRTTKPFN